MKEYPFIVKIINHSYNFIPTHADSIPTLYVLGEYYRTQNIHSTLLYISI